MTARLHEIPRQPWPSRCGYCEAEVTAEDDHWRRGYVSLCRERFDRRRPEVAP